MGTEYSFTKNRPRYSRERAFQSLFNLGAPTGSVRGHGLAKGNRVPKKAIPGTLFRVYRTANGRFDILGRPRRAILETDPGAIADGAQHCS